MSAGPELSQLSHAQKDALIAALMAELAAMRARLAEMEAKLGLPPKTPDNSSIPPSKGQKASQPAKPQAKKNPHAGAHRPLHPNPTCERVVLAFACQDCGVDVSNVDGGSHALLLPADPDRSARKLHREIKKRTSLAIPVLITDTFGRPWREGLVDFCIGIAGMKPMRDDRGRRDSHGYKLQASLEAVADELACAAGLVCGKLNRTPACIVRGFRYEAALGRVRDLLRPAASDLFR